MPHRIRDLITNFGWPRIIIALFPVSLFVAAPFVNVGIGVSLSDLINRFGMNAILALALVPMVQSGCGLNFGLPVGVIAGLLGATISIEAGCSGAVGFATALAIACLIATVLGLGYGLLLNRVKGDEMLIATFVGFASVAFMSILWLLIPFRSPTLIRGFAGKGLRTTISLDGLWPHILSDRWSFRVGSDFLFPTGMIAFSALACVLVWAFMHTKTGTALAAVGSSPESAQASGINVNRMRTVSVVLSTILGAVGILVYQQGFGFIQLYNAPLDMAFPAVAAILIGGASVNKATITNAVIGTLLFQGILTMTASVVNSVVKTDLSGVIRILVSNGMILYALTGNTKGAK